MLLGIRMNEQKRIADRGHQMRVYVPFGEDWYGHGAPHGRAPGERPVLPALARHQRLSDFLRSSHAGSGGWSAESR